MSLHVIQVTDTTWLSKADISDDVRQSSDRMAAWVFTDREQAHHVADALRGRGYLDAQAVDATANAKRFEPGVSVPANDACTYLAPGQDCDCTTPSWCKLSDCPRAPSAVPDPVHTPEHYQARDGSGLECIDAMRAMLTPDEFRGYLRGNALKYQWRYRAKSGTEDLAKARRYLDLLTMYEECQR